MSTRGGAYRDRLGALRLQLGARREALAVRREGYTPLFWKTLDADIARELKQLDAQTAVDLSTAEVPALDSLAKHLDAIEALLQRQLARLPQLEAEWLSVAALAPVVTAWVGNIDTDAFYPIRRQSMAKACGYALVMLDREGSLRAIHNDAAWVGELRVRGVHLRFAYDVGVVIPDREDVRVTTQMRWSVAMPKVAGTLTLKVQTLGASLLAWVGARPDHEVGDAAFDRCFTVGGDAASAAMLLTPEVRRGLLRVASVAAPQLTIKDGEGRLEIEAEASWVLVRDVTEVLSGLQRAATAQIFVRP